jgi:hypothetical protein
MNLRGQNQLVIRQLATLHVSFPATSRSTRIILHYLPRPLQLLNLNEPIRFAQSRLSVNV